MFLRDASGQTVNVREPSAPGRATAATSRPVALSEEDKAVLDAVARQDTLAAILAKLIAGPATAARQDATNLALADVVAALATLVGGTVLAAGSDVVGRFGVDQGTPGVSNGVTDAALVPKGMAVVTVGAGAKTLAQLLSAVPALGGDAPAGSRIVYIQPRDGDIRFADGGSTPVISNTGLGIDIFRQMAWPYYGALDGLKLIAAANTSVSLAFYG